MRPSSPTPSAEIGRPQKPGLLGAPHEHGGAGRGTPGPDGGFALSLAARLVHRLELAPNESVHDIEIGIALLAAKRAGLVGRAPSRSDVEVALDLFRFRGRADDAVASDRRRRFKGVAHSYETQRAFVDGVSDDALRQQIGAVRALVHFTAPRPFP